LDEVGNVVIHFLLIQRPTAGVDQLNSVLILVALRTREGDLHPVGWGVPLPAWVGMHPDVFTPGTVASARRSAGFGNATG